MSPGHDGHRCSRFVATPRRSAAVPASISGAASSDSLPSAKNDAFLTAALHGVAWTLTFDGNFTPELSVAGSPHTSVIPENSGAPEFSFILVVFPTFLCHATCKLRTIRRLQSTAAADRVMNSSAAGRSVADRAVTGLARASRCASVVALNAAEDWKSNDTSVARRMLREF